MHVCVCVCVMGGRGGGSFKSFLVGEAQEDKAYNKVSWGLEEVREISKLPKGKCMKKNFIFKAFYLKSLMFRNIKMVI